ncbi:MAG: alpha/beta fold hydrolase [Bacilli bacterium]
MSTFTIKIDEKFSLSGNHYPIEDAKAYLLVITGMDEHSDRYEGFAKFLNKEGIDVYVLDDFGQGLNAKTVDSQQKWPKDAWNMTIKALNLEVNALRPFGKPVYLMGHSMGSFMVQSYLEKYPDTVDKAIIMGSNGPRRALLSVANFLSHLTTTKGNWDKPSKLMQNMAIGGYVKAVKDRKTDNDWLSYNEENVKRYNADPYCGHPNTCGFYREFFTGMNTLYKGKNKKNISVKERILIVAGAEDPVGDNGVGPQKLYKMYKDLGVKDVSIIVYPHMRHEILNETDPSKPLNDIRDFLKK